jgi:hypothetical protein
MKNVMKRLNLIRLILLIFFSIYFIIRTTAQTRENRGFKVFDAIHYYHKPDLTKFGLRKINLIYEPYLTRKDSTNEKINLIDTAKIIEKAKEALLEPDVPVSLDIESWWSIRDSVEVTKRYTEVVNVFRRYNKVSPIGFYGIGPLSLNTGRWLNNNDYEKALKGWNFYNHLLSPTREFVNVLFPSFYIMNNLDMDTWVKDIKFCVRDARRNNKPVYAYIWPQYYDAKTNPFFKKFIDPKTWTFILETCYRLCDGVVIWTSTIDEHKARINWGDSGMRPFWKATKKFMKKHHIK